MNPPRRNQPSGGFSLIETLVAITILTASITGPLYLAYLGIRTSRDARYELTATHLAAEALEVAQAWRNARAADAPTLSDAQWYDIVFSRCDSTFGCVFDTTMSVDPSLSSAQLNARIPECPNVECKTSSPAYDLSQLYYNSTSKIFRQGSFNPSAIYIKTPYKRVVTMRYVPGPGVSPQVTVTATVTFTRSNGKTGTVEVSTDLYNWFPEI